MTPELYLKFDFFNNTGYLIKFYNYTLKGFLHVMVTLDFDKTNGLIPAIAQDYKTGEVLMLAYMNRQAFDETVKSGRATYYSRSRQTLWKKEKHPVMCSMSKKSGWIVIKIRSC